MPSPRFRDDGFLPEGVHLAELDEVCQRFGIGTPRRRKLMEQVEQWIEVAQLVNAPRFLLDGSFVTKKRSPNDVDAVILLPSDYEQRIRKFDSFAWELRDSVHYRQPPELHAAKNEHEWQAWIKYFSQIRGTKRTKGMIAVRL